MTNQEIFELIACFDRSTAQVMKLSAKDFSIELSRGAGPTISGPVEGAAAPVPEAPLPSPAPTERFILSPLVGTYHAAPAPDQPPLVAAGDRVHKGQTVCLIEAMKMMSEITAPCDCIIEELLLQDGALVAFDAPLLRYRKAESC